MDEEKKLSSDGFRSNWSTWDEKNFAFNNLSSSDLSNSFSEHEFNNSELKKMIDAIRDTERAIGSSAKRILDEEVELRNFAKRSIQAITDIKRGEILKEGKNFDILRSGNKKRGMEPRFISKIEGKKSEREFKKKVKILN